MCRWFSRVCPAPDFRIVDRSGVVVVTNVPPHAVVAAWRHAAVGIVPSVVPEGFGRVAVECLAAGTPCVVSAIGGLLDVVTDGVDGVHVPPGDAAALACAIQRLLGDERLRSRLGAAGPAKAAQFTLSQVMPQLDEVYLQVLDDTAAGSQIRRKNPGSRRDFDGDDRNRTEGAVGMTASTAAGSSKSTELAAMPLVLMYHSISPYDEDPYEVTMTPNGSSSRCAGCAAGGCEASRWESCSGQRPRGGRADWWD